jgi:hypothetical protein
MLYRWNSQPSLENLLGFFITGELHFEHGLD